MHGFPAALASFIGRAGARRDVAGLVEECRLVTVTGPGGVGKTRLAGQVARLVAGRFADGAWLAELAPVRDPAQVAAVVAAALGIREQPGTPVAGALARVLAGQQLLLVLDNCEHVIGGAAELCAGLLAACDDVRVLATSREPLAVAGEARYRLGPLTLPAPGDTADGGRSEAVALDGENGPVVARLDGMPLAIELAAARVEALGVAGLLDRIGDRFALLTGGDRLAAGRQRSLSATVEWSYRLLEEHERRVFRMVSVFPGVFTLEAAEAVAGPGAGAVVLRLVDCSLLVPPRAGPDGRSRYVMLETLRAYGAGLLAGAGEQDEAAAALAGHALRVAKQAAAGLQSGDGELAAARWLDAEDATMRQALGWAGAHDPALALRLANALGWWWVLRGRLPGEYPLVCQAAGAAEAGSGGWCAAQIWLGWAAQVSADLAASLSHFTAVRDAVAGRPPSPALTAALACRATALRLMGPDRRGGRRRPQRAGPGPADRGPGRGAAGPGRAQLRSRLRRRSRRGGAAGPPGRADHDRDPRRARPEVQLCAGQRAGRCREPGRSRACRRGGPGPGPGRGRPVEPGELAAQDRGAGPAGGPDRRRCGAPAGRAPPRGADRQLV
jgi:predicted ATPase